MTILDMLKQKIEPSPLLTPTRRSIPKEYLEGRLDTEDPLPSLQRRPNTRIMTLAKPNKNKYLIQNDFGAPIANYAPEMRPLLNREGSPLMANEGMNADGSARMVPQYNPNPLGVPLTEGGASKRNKSILDMIRFY